MKGTAKCWAMFSGLMSMIHKVAARLIRICASSLIRLDRPLELRWVSLR